MGEHSWFSGLPSRWPTVPIRRIARLGTGHTPDRANAEYWIPRECTIPWVTVADIQHLPGLGLEPLVETQQLISPLGLAHSAAVLHPADTVMLSRTASIGHACLIGRPMATTQAFVTWTPGPLVDPRYLLLAVKALGPELDRLAYGSTHLTIYMPDIETLRIPLPPIATQAAIVEYVHAETARIDALIVKKRRMIELSGDRYRSALHYAFEQLSAREVPLGRFTSSISQGVSPQASSHSANADEWGLLKLSAVDEGTFRPSENKALPSEYPVDLSLVPKVGDVLVTRSNTPRYVGDACAVTEDPGKVLLCDLIYRLKVNSQILPEFAALALLRPAARAHLSSSARGTSQSMVKLRGEDVKATPIPFVSLNTQHNVLAALDAEKRKRSAIDSVLRTQIQLLTEHRQALITAAVTGELELPGAAA